AMSPRHLGGIAVIVKSFARIHETNLKKQGMLALTFANPKDYDKIQADDLLSIVGLTAFAPGKNLTLKVLHGDGTTDQISLAHSYNKEQTEWFVAESAWNLIRKGRASKSAGGKASTTKTAKKKNTSAAAKPKKKVKSKKGRAKAKAKPKKKVAKKV